MGTLALLTFLLSCLQAKPALLSKQPALLREFEAAPWLLPPRTPALPYAGVHDFDQLLALRSAPVGNYSKAIALLLFSKAYGLMAQNSGEQACVHCGPGTQLVASSSCWKQGSEVAQRLRLPYALPAAAPSPSPPSLHAGAPALACPAWLLAYGHCTCNPHPWLCS